MALMRGCKLSARHHLANATPHRADGPVPVSFFRLAKTPLPMFGNDRYGDCVTAEEFSAKAADGHLGSDLEAITAAERWGGINGADLATILDDAAKGFTCGGQVLDDGPKQSVNYLDWSALTAAIYSGQVKIAVAADQIQRAGAGQEYVWFLTIASLDREIDHCVGLAGYGTLAECCAALGAVPAGNVSADLPCVVLETWGGYGIVGYTSLLAVMGSTATSGNSEAWLRVPTTVIPGPGPTPAPPAPPIPTPTPTPCQRWREAARHLLAAGALLAADFEDSFGG